jgi:hypothetical protein
VTEGNCQAFERSCILCISARHYDSVMWARTWCSTSRSRWMLQLALARTPYLSALVCSQGPVVGLPSAPRNLGRHRQRFRTVKGNTATESQHPGKRGAIEGPIRIPLDSQLFLFNALALLSISSKSFRFRSVLYSIPTAPTKTCFGFAEWPIC